MGEHNHRTYVNRVGELTADRKFVLGIFESVDDEGRHRYTVQSIASKIRVDASKVLSVRPFAADAVSDSGAG